MRFFSLFFIIFFCCSYSAYTQADTAQYSIVDYHDLAVLSNNWLMEEPNNSDVTSNADFNNDSIVNLNDFSILADYWLKIPQGYNKTNVSVLAGNYRYLQVDGEPSLFPGKTYGFISNRFKAAGILRTVRIKLYTESGTEPIAGVAKLKLLSGNNNPFTLKADIDITEAINLAKQQTDAYGRFDFEYDFISSNVTVAADDFLAVYFPENIACVRLTPSTISYSGLVFCNSGGDAVSSSVPLEYQINSKPYIMDYRVDTNDFIIFDTDTGFNAGSYVDVPSFENEPQYLILEDVYVPSNENMKIDLCCTLDDGSDGILKTIELNFRLPNRYIAFGNHTSTVQVYAGNKYNLHIWIDPQRGRIDMLYVNKTSFNTSHISMTCRKPEGFIPETYTQRVKIHQDYGSRGSVKRVVVCRKPILAIGDSFVSTYVDGTTLSNVGRALTYDDVFSKKRYVINGGITGNEVLESGSATAIKTRWNGTNNDLCAYRDVIVTFVNGPGLNDISSIYASSTSQEIEQKAKDIAQAVNNMAAEALAIGDKFGGQNNVIMCELIPYTAKMQINYQQYLNQKSCQEQLNLLLYQFAAANNVAFTSVYDDIPSSYYDGTHPNAQGSLWIARRIAQAYEEH